MSPTLSHFRRKLPFLRWGAFGAYNAPLTIGSIQPGASLDYAALSGEVLDNSVVAACVNAIAQALPDAPIYLERRSNTGWARVNEHPMLDLLRRPNPYHSEADLWGATVAMERTRGQAFWYLETEDGTPREIWYVASEKVQLESTAESFISGYLITSEEGQPVRFDNSQVIHFRHQMHPLAPRIGWTPLGSGKRQIAGDNLAATYHSAILRNSGVLSLLITLKDGAAAGEVTPGQLEEFTSKLKGKLFGEGAGAVAGLDLPLEVHKLSYSPDEMALDRLINYYESRICALLGVDPMVAGLGSGTAQKTYANLGEALNDFWERQIIPLRNRHAATLGAQLLPLFESNPNDWRVRFDYSNVAALQENLDALHTRVRADWEKRLIDLKTARQRLGYAGDELSERKFEKVFFGDKPDGGSELKAWDESKHPRDELGRWTDGSHSISGAATPIELGSIVKAPTPRLSAARSAEEALKIMQEAHQRIEKATAQLNAEIAFEQAKIDGYAVDKLQDRPEVQEFRDTIEALTGKRDAIVDEINAEATSALYVDDPIHFDHSVDKNISDGWRLRSISTGMELASKFISSKVVMNTIHFEKHPHKGARSEYKDEGGFQRVLLDEDGGTPTVLHELGHHLESCNPLLHEKVVEHLKQRTVNSGLEPMGKPGEGYDSSEKTRPDKFYTRYMGKQYKNHQYTEIVSSGLEFYVRNPVEFAVKDPDSFKFVFGILRGQ